MIANMKKDSPDFALSLRSAGYRATSTRINLLKMLWLQTQPLTVSEIQKKLGRSVDGVTVYRALQAFQSSGLVREVDFQHGHAHYELILGKEHHHHLVCTGCCVVEDISLCLPPLLEKKILSKSKRFDSIADHSMEFFGLCNICFIKPNLSLV